jgi:hypothetical protein
MVFLIQPQSLSPVSGGQYQAGFPEMLLQLLFQHRPFDHFIVRYQYLLHTKLLLNDGLTLSPLAFR